MESNVLGFPSMMKLVSLLDTHDVLWFFFDKELSYEEIFTLLLSSLPEEVIVEILLICFGERKRINSKNLIAEVGKIFSNSRIDEAIVVYKKFMAA